MGGGENLLRVPTLLSGIVAGQPLCIYGDPAYPIRVDLQCLFRNGALTPQMEAYNTAMSTVRSSVEWLFGDIISYFKFLDFKVGTE